MVDLAHRAYVYLFYQQLAWNNTVPVASVAFLVRCRATCVEQEPSLFGAGRGGLLFHAIFLFGVRGLAWNKAAWNRAIVRCNVLVRPAWNKAICVEQGKKLANSGVY